MIPLITTYFLFIIFSLAHSFIVDLSPSSKIKGEFSNEEWAELVKRRPEAVRKSYHHEIEPLISHLFGKKVRLFGLKSDLFHVNITLIFSSILDGSI
jgi:hypothetical protein